MAKKKNVDEELVTKGYLKDELNTRFSHFETKIDLKFDDFRDEIDERLTQFRSDIFDKMDEAISEFRKGTEELAAHSFFHQRINDNLHSLDKRVAHLEKSPPRH